MSDTDIIRKPIKLVYIAGPLTPTGKHSGNLAIEYLENVRRMVTLARELISWGYVPFCPALDYQYFLSNGEGETITESSIMSISMEWLKVSDAVLLAEGWEDSWGTLREIETAGQLHIPCFTSIEKLNDHEVRANE